MQASQCKNHPTRSIDTICFHSQCQEKGTQLLCLQCVMGGEHSQHGQFVEILHPTSKTFKALNSLQRQCSKVKVVEQMNEVDNFATNLQNVILDQFRQWKFRKLARLECLINFLSKSQMDLVINNILSNSNVHSSCCLKMLNQLHSTIHSDEKDEKKLQQMVHDEVISEVKSLLLKANNIKQIFIGMIKSKNYEEYNIGQTIIKQQIEERTNVFEQKLKQMIEKQPEQPLQQKSNEQMIGNAQIVENSSLLNESFSLNQIKKPFPKEIPQNNDQICDIDEQKLKQSEQVIALDSKIGQTEKNENQKHKKDVSMHFSQKFPSKNDEQEKINFQRYLIEEKEKEDQEHMQQKVQKYSNKKKICKFRYRTRIKSRKQRPIQIHSDSQRGEVASRDKNKMLEPLSQRQKSQRKLQKSPQNMGIYLLNQSLLRIQDSTKQKDLLEYLKKNKQIQHLIINKPNLTRPSILSSIIQRLPKLVGIHIQCNHFLKKNQLNQIKIQYLTFNHSYRFLSEKDLIKTFPLNIDDDQQYIQPKVLNISKGSYMITNKESFEFIGQQTQQLNVLKQSQDYSISNNNIKNITLKCTKLIILSFTQINLMKSIKLAQIYQKNKLLNTLAFNKCSIHLDSIVKQFSHLDKDHFQNLQISVPTEVGKSTLNQRNFKQICKLTNLKTLILSRINFKETDQFLSIKNYDKYFCPLKQLTKLTHINLYQSASIKADFFKNLSVQCLQNITTLNIGHTQVDESVTSILSKMKNMKNLILDATKINGKDIVIFLKQMTKIERLSIESLNGNIIQQRSSGKSCQKYGYIFTKHLKVLNIPSLKYINISGCSQLRLFQWNNFPGLKYLLIEIDQLDLSVANKLRQRGIRLIEKYNKNRTSQILQQYLKGNRVFARASNQPHHVDLIEFINDSSEKSFDSRSSQRSHERPHHRERSRGQKSLSKEKKMAEQSDVDKGKSSNCQQFSSKLKKRIQQPHRGVKKSRRGRNLSKKS